jgi:hypothetical protein
LERLKASVALLTTSPVIEPVVVPSPIWRVPVEIVVRPLKVFSPVSVRVPAPALVIEPEPSRIPP